MNVCIVGTGYVGLVTGACLAELGHSVVCVDHDALKIARLRQGEIPIYEPGLKPLVAENAAAGRLSFTPDLARGAAGETLALFFAVGTPSSEDGAAADLKPLFSAVRQAAVLRREQDPQGFVAMVVKSTVPVGTCSALTGMVAEILPRDRFAVVSNPEFLREGCAIDDFMTPDRIVVGSASPRGLALMREIYAPLTEEGHRLIELTSVETSEMIKYAANAFLATKIGLINEFSRLCEKVDADIGQLSLGVGLDRRIGQAGLMAGPGFGGSCFPKDLRALVRTAEEFGSPMTIASAVMQSNERQKRSMFDRILEHFDGDVRNLRVAVLGLSFKAGTDDIRESPPLTVIAALLDAGAIVAAYDPVAMPNASRLLPEVEFAASAEEAVADCDAVVVATEWREFADLDWAGVLPTMRAPLLFDMRNLLDGSTLAELGFSYVGLGRRRRTAVDVAVEVDETLPEAVAAE